MIRPNNERVKIMIDPGNYEEMLVIDVDSVSWSMLRQHQVLLCRTRVLILILMQFVSLRTTDRLQLLQYGNEPKMECRYIESKQRKRIDQLCKHRWKYNKWFLLECYGCGYESGFHSQGIIFENSFNQYISKKESEDVVKEWATGGKGTRPVTIGSTAVQAKSFVERAAAIAITKSADKTVLDKCRVVGRQDSFYGAEGARVVAYKGALWAELILFSGV